jgi:hypothetical protein
MSERTYEQGVADAAQLMDAYESRRLFPTPLIFINGPAAAVRTLTPRPVNWPESRQDVVLDTPRQPDKANEKQESA